MTARPLPVLRACRRRYGPVFTLRVSAHPPLVFVCDRDEIQAVLKADEQLLRPGDGAAAVKPIVGEESFMLKHGAPHRSAHRALQPVIGAGAVEHHAAMVRRTAQDAIEAWPTGTPIELHGRLRALTLEVILRLIVGTTAGPLDQLCQRIHRSVLAMLEITSSPLLTESYMRVGPGRVMWRTFLRRREVVDRLLLELIDTAEDGPAEGLLAVLTALRNSEGSAASRRRVRDNIMSIILAGHETTAAQLAWAVQLLARHPDVQASLACEHGSARADGNARAAVQEILRHSCTFLFAIPRTLTRPIELGGYRCEPPAQLLPCIYLLHHDADHHPDPHAIVWDRYAETSPDRRTWLPWGGGPRRCPGRHLAILEITTILQTLLATRTISATSERIERPRWRSVIVTPGGNRRVILHRRAETR
jgi:cytochrome P450